MEDTDRRMHRYGGYMHLGGTIAVERIQTRAEEIIRLGDAPRAYTFYELVPPKPLLITSQLDNDPLSITLIERVAYQARRVAHAEWVTEYSHVDHRLAKVKLYGYYRVYLAYEWVREKE